MWTDHPQFMEVVSKAWGCHFQGSPGLRLGKKLNHLKQILKTWNWNSFGDLKDKSVKLQTHVIELENQLQQSWSELTHTEWDNARKELQQVKAWETEGSGAKRG